MMGILRRWLELLGVPGRAPAGATRSPDPADHTTWDTHEWDFDVIQVPADGLPAVVLGFFEDLGLVRDPVHRAAIGSFVAVVQRHYSPQNPYHNFQHCVDVTHATFLMLVGIRAAVSDIECYALLLAALAHDLEHPGVNNAYLIKSRDPLAITYNDTSVLENRHAACLFEIVARYVVLEVLRSRSQPPMMTVPSNSNSQLTRHQARHRNLRYPDADVFRDMGAEERELARKLIIHAIIHTDMCKHFPMIDRIRDWGAMAPSAVPDGEER